jgi:hypothetical protein
MEYLPVCGIDGVTYGNACAAGNVAISHTGECVNITVGGDRDAHGCIGSAGYSWDSVLNACTRPWETDALQKAFDFVLSHGVTVRKTLADFRPFDTVTRQEAATFFVRAAENIYGQKYASFPEKCNILYKDHKHISNSFRSVVYQACALGLMVGNNRSFMPTDTLSRGQTLAVLVRMTNNPLSSITGSLGQAYLDHALSLGLLTDTAFGNFDSAITRGDLIQLLHTIALNNDKGNIRWSLQKQLDTAKTLWKNSALTSYTLTQSLNCFCTPDYTKPYTYQVKNGVIDLTTVQTTPSVSTTTDARPTFHTVVEAFDIIQDAIDGKAERIEVTYDATLGYPKSISIDRSKMIADEEQYFTFSLVK